MLSFYRQRERKARGCEKVGFNYEYNGIAIFFNATKFKLIQIANMQRK